MTTGVAIIGCGGVGAKRAAALPESARLVAVYDVDPDRAAALASADAVVADDLDSAVTAHGVDLVIVSTTHDQLPVAALAAVAAGRHVLVEKPGAAALGPLVELAAAAEANDRLVRAGFNHRFHPAIRRARRIVESGRYGPLLGIRARYGHGGRVGYDREWRADPVRSGGGELIDQGMHLIDLTRCFAGDVELAFAELRTDFWDMAVEDNAYLALRPTGGGFAWLHASWTEWKNTFHFEIALRTAKLEIVGLGGSYGPERLTLHEMAPEMGPPATTTWEYPGADRSWADELVDVLGAIDGAPGEGASLDDCIAAFTIADEAYRR